MGFFSWNCAVSSKSLSNIYAGVGNSSAYLITPDKVYYEPEYEGYGVFAGVDVYELLGDGDRDQGIENYFNGNPKFDIKIVLSQYYQNQKYADLPKSKSCKYQGYFYNLR